MLWTEPILSAMRNEPPIRTEMMTPEMRPKVRTIFFMRCSLCDARMESRYGETGPDVVILSDDFAGRNEAEIMLSDDAVTAGGLVLCRAGWPECGGRLRACRRRVHSVS